MKTGKLVTIYQASLLRRLGFKEPTTRYAYKFTEEEEYKLQHTSIREYSFQTDMFLNIPTVDEAIDWIRRKHNVIIANKAIPFINPVTNKIVYSFTVKWCNSYMGWNGRITIGHSHWNSDCYVSKREAITLALKWIKKQKENKQMKKKTVHSICIDHGKIISMKSQLYPIITHKKVNKWVDIMKKKPKYIRFFNSMYPVEVTLQVISIEEDINLGEAIIRIKLKHYENSKSRTTVHNKRKSF